MIKAFFFGIFGAISALLIEIIFLVFASIGQPDLAVDMFINSLLFISLATITEEICKIGLLYKLLLEGKGTRRLVIFFFGTGFALLEFFAVRAKQFSLIEALGIGFIHLVTAVSAGVVFLILGKKKMALFLALALGIALHGAYNYWIFTH
jgi:hypothetical protein